MKKIYFALFATVVSASAVVAEHHEAGAKRAGMWNMQAKMERHFDNLDTDKDGKISLEEQTAECKKKFEERDINKDGFLTKDEIKSHLEQMKNRRSGMRPNNMQAAPVGGGAPAATTTAPASGAVQPAHPAP